jgi:putative ABC transport system permease protein
MPNQAKALSGRWAMESRLLAAALLRKRAMLSLAVLAIAIGAALAGALVHVSRDVSRKLTRELRALGPNLLLLPPEAAARSAATPGGPALPESFLRESDARARLAAAGLEGAALLLVGAQADGRAVPLVGADLEALRRLHPSWQAPAPPGATLIGARLARALDVSPGETLHVRYPATGAALALPVGGTLESGGPDDEAFWVPLAAAQALTGLAGRVSVVQARVEAPDRISAAVAALERGGGARAQVLRALSATEADLLERTRRLMAYVTVAALVLGGLCAYGTLTDLALERRREIALLKALGATPGEVVRLLGSESAAVGALGGLLGWGLGALGAQAIGRQVFQAAVAPQWDVLPIVLGISTGVALLAGLGPIRLALAVEPAPTLKGE